MGDIKVDERKRELRTRFKRIRRDLAPDERTTIDALITERLVMTPAYADAQVLLPYLSFGAEVDTKVLIRRAWADGKTVALPRCVENSREMEWFVVTSFDDLVRSPLGMDEPRRDPSRMLDVGDGTDALVLVPGLSFDPSGYRMGYGGGFYDTFLTRFAGTSVGLCRECQMSDDLSELGVIDVHDRPVDMVVTERRTLCH